MDLKKLESWDVFFMIGGAVITALLWYYKYIKK